MRATSGCGWPSRARWVGAERDVGWGLALNYIQGNQKKVFLFFLLSSLNSEKTKTNKQKATYRNEPVTCGMVYTLGQ